MVESVAPRFVPILLVRCAGLLHKAQVCPDTDDHLRMDGRRCGCTSETG